MGGPCSYRPSYVPACKGGTRRLAPLPEPFSPRGAEHPGNCRRPRRGWLAQPAADCEARDSVVWIGAVACSNPVVLLCRSGRRIHPKPRFLGASVAAGSGRAKASMGPWASRGGLAGSCGSDSCLLPVLPRKQWHAVYHCRRTCAGRAMRPGGFSPLSGCGWANQAAGHEPGVRARFQLRSLCRRRGAPPATHRRPPAGGLIAGMRGRSVGPRRPPRCGRSL